MTLGLRTVLPLGALVVAVIVLVLALRPTPPLDVAFAAPDAGPRLAGPELSVGTRVLTGVLVDNLGLPVAGATIVAEREGRPIWTDTDDRGRFELAELDTGPLTLSIVHDEFGALEVETAVGAGLSAGPLELRLGPRLPQVPTVPPPLRAPLAGRVTTRTADSCEGFELFLRPVLPADATGSGVPHRVALAADGSFSIEALEAGEYELTLLPPWAVGDRWPDLLRGLDGEPVRLMHPPADDAPPLALVCVAGEISGRVVAGERPLEGAMLTVAPAGDDGHPTSPQELFPAARTDAQGRYRIPLLPPGTYAVELRAGNDRRSAVVRVPAGGSVDPGL